MIIQHLDSSALKSIFSQSKPNLEKTVEYRGRTYVQLNLEERLGFCDRVSTLAKILCPTNLSSFQHHWTSFWNGKRATILYGEKNMVNYLVHTKLAKDGNADSQYILGTAHYNSFLAKHDTKNSLKKAQKYIVAAANQEHSEALYFLGKRGQKTNDQQLALQCFFRASVKNHQGALDELTAMYHLTIEDLENGSSQQALELLQNLANNNLEGAMEQYRDQSQ